VIAIAAGAFAVSNLRLVFGSNRWSSPGRAGIAEDTDPKIVVLEVFGTGGTAVINYLDLDGKPQRATDPALPWSLEMTTPRAAANVNLLAQSRGDSITCRITVDGEVKDERTATGMNAKPTAGEGRMSATIDDDTDDTTNPIPVARQGPRPASPSSRGCCDAGHPGHPVWWPTSWCSTPLCRSLIRSARCARSR
jgi:hypothetical protein